MTQCATCGRSLPDDAEFCPDCGRGPSKSDPFSKLDLDLASVHHSILQLTNQVSKIRDTVSTLRAARPATPPRPSREPEHRAAPPPPAPSSRAASTPTFSPAAYAPPPPPPRPRARPSDPSAEIRFGQKWLLIGGVVIVVLGIGYFLKYSFDQNWIGPAGRVAMAYLTGIVGLALGEGFRRKKFELFGLYIIGGGIATLYFSTFAGFQIYNLIPQVVAFVLMVLTTALAGSLALFYDTKWLAVLGIVGGFMTPILLSTGVDNQPVLMTYMAILNGGILWLASFKQWNLLNHLGFTLTWLLFSGWYGRHYNNDKFWLTTFYLNLFFAVYALAPYLYYFIQRRAGNVQGVAMTVLNAMIAFSYSFAMIRGHTSLPAVSLASVGYALVFLALSSHLYRRDKKASEAFVLLLATALVFLVITIPVLFSKHWITVFWAAQAGALLWAAIRLKSEKLFAGAWFLLIVTVTKFLFYDYDYAFSFSLPLFRFRDGYFDLWVERMLCTAMVLGTTYAAVPLMKGAPKELQDVSTKALSFAAALFGILLFLSLNIEVGAYFSDVAPQARFAAISVLWALFAIAVMVLGFLKEEKALRTCSIILFAVTVFKVFFVDMANVSTPFRIISFVVLGLLLIGASYLYHRYKDRILPPRKPEEV